jgi:hypothetical protein
MFQFGVLKSGRGPQNFAAFFVFGIVLIKASQLFDFMEIISKFASRLKRADY